MKIDNKTFFSVQSIDNVEFFGDLFLDYPTFDSVLVLGATYDGIQMTEGDLLELNNDRALVQVLCLDYISNLCDLDNVY
jgi:hypothetical protein